MQLPGFKSHLIQLDLVASVVRIGFDRFLVVRERGVIVLQGLRLHALVILDTALRAAHCEQPDTDTQDESSPALHALSEASKRS